MRFIGTSEQTKRFAIFTAIDRLGKEPVDVFHVRVLAAHVLKRKHRPRINVRLARLRHAIAQRLQVMHNTFHVRIGPRVIRPGAALHRIQARVNIMPRGRTHRRRLKATGEPHPFGGQPVDMRRLRLPTITPDIPKRAVVRDDKHHVRLTCRNRKNTKKPKQPKTRTNIHGNRPRLRANAQRINHFISCHERTG